MPGGPSSLFYKYIIEKSFFLVYGPYATGKTHLAYEAYLVAEMYGYKPIIIATEPGTASFLSGLDVDSVRVLTMDELAREATKAVVNGRYTVIDSINWLYRENPGPEHGRLLAYVSALLGSKGGFATAQVAGGDDEASGFPYMFPWSRVIARTRRETGLYLLEFMRPLRRILGFEIRGKRVKWL